MTNKSTTSQISTVHTIFIKLCKNKNIAPTMGGGGVGWGWDYCMNEFSRPRLRIHLGVQYLQSRMIFRSIELKAQVSFLIACRPCVFNSFFIYFPSSSLEPLGLFQPNLAQSIPRCYKREFNFVQMKDHALFQGEIIPKYSEIK